jgi:hypothetical protein
VRRLKDVFVPEDSLGRKSRRAVDRFSPSFCRAGFEPRRGRPAAPSFQAAETDDTLGDATRTHGSNPARLRHWEVTTAIRAEIFALPRARSLPPGSWILAPDSSPYNP